MLVPNIKEPQVQTVKGYTGLFFNYRNNQNVSRWKTYIKCNVCKTNCLTDKSNFYTGKIRMCKKCSLDRVRAKGKNHPGYINGKTQKKNGYVDILLEDGDKYLCMATTGRYVAEHRYLMAKKLGRPLKTSEHVHHINGIKNDNRIDNLVLLDGGVHQIVTQLELKIKRLEKRIKELELC